MQLEAGYGKKATMSQITLIRTDLMDNFCSFFLKYFLEEGDNRK
jgi:hypothetical protein